MVTDPRRATLTGTLRLLPRKRMGISVVIFEIIQADKSVLDRWLDWTSRPWRKRWYVAWKIFTVSQRFGGILEGLGFKGDEVRLVAKQISEVFSNSKLAEEVSENLELIRTALDRDLQQGQLELNDLLARREAAIDYIIQLPIVEKELKRLIAGIKGSSSTIAEAEKELKALDNFLRQIDEVRNIGQEPVHRSDTVEHSTPVPTTDGSPEFRRVGDRQT